MPTITLLTDFGDHGYYAAALKASILKDCPSATIVDISHKIPNGNIGEAGFLLKAVYSEFSAGTVHLVAVGAASQSPSSRHLAIRSDNHYFVAADNGVIDLTIGEQMANAVELPEITPDIASFPSKYILAPAAAALANNLPLEDIGEPTDSWIKKRFPVARHNDRSMKGQVLHVDGYGNLITNISFSDFQEFRQGRRFEIRFAYERFHQIETHYNAREFGDCVLLFNSLGLLEIAINQGNAQELLGMKVHSPIIVDFLE